MRRDIARSKDRAPKNMASSGTVSRVGGAALALMVVLMVTTSLPAAVTVQSSYYAPDRGTPYKWFENAREIAAFFDQHYRAAGYLHLYLRNAGREAIDATEFTLNGMKLEELRGGPGVIWWRLLPRPLAPGAVGEVMVRLRDPLDSEARLEVAFSDGSRAVANIAPSPNPLRIETIGFDEAGRAAFLVVERLDGHERVLKQVLVDGVDVTAKCRLLAPRFIGGLSPVSMRFDAPLKVGGYHVYTVRCADGATASCCLRTTDGWVPLGSYGYGTYDEFARNGCNGHNNFGRSGKGDLDQQAMLGMRAVSMLGASDVEAYEVGHPGLFAHCLQDEPDVADYGVEGVPAHLRVGHSAMAMEGRAQKVRAGNPTKLSLLTLDMTYKPANYYIYGPIADVVNPDCYPISLDADATMVREVVETARRGAGPRPLTFTFQGVMEGPRDPAAFAKKRFPRPNFPAEERIMMYYAIGAGARGLFNYIHCTENSETRWSRGTQEFPELWNEIGQVYRELDHVAPLIALAHPTTLARSSEPKLWVRLLLCGDKAALVVWVNDDYKQERMSVTYRPLRDVRVALPELPWLRGARAYSVGAGGFSEIEATGQVIHIPRADVAGMILLTTDRHLPSALTARYEERKQHVATALLEEWRGNLAATAKQQTAFRILTGGFGSYAAHGKGIGAYGASVPTYWNPEQAQYNVLEFGSNDAGPAPTQGAEWSVTIPADRAGRPHVVYVCCGAWGQPGLLSVRDARGTTVAETRVSGAWEGRVCPLRFVPAAPGPYTIGFAQPGDGPKGGRVGEVAYVVPEDELFDASLAPE